MMDIIYPPSKEGEPLNLNRLERGILLANDLPGAGAGVQLMAGEKAGTTDIDVKIQNKSRIQGSLTLDNFGSRMTGRDRAQLSLNLQSPFGWAESIGLTTLKTDGTKYARTSFIMPVGNNGLKLGVNANYLEYEIVADEYQSAGVFGRSRGIGSLASYPIYRSRTKNLNIELNYDVKRFINKNISGTQSDYFTRIYTSAFPFDFTDQLIAEGASNDGRLIFIHGKNDHFDDAITNGYFNIAQFNFQRQQFFKYNFGVNFKINGQKSDHNLDSSQKIYLGGASGVRAYPATEAGGSNGYQYSVELQKFLPYDFT
jgi:hemolysin activation/secretion protein